MDDRTILIIDDCQEDREIFTRYLEFAGGRVLEGCNGEEGLRIAQEQLPDVILLDLSMPVLDGWQTIERLQNGSATAVIPVVALTAQHLSWEELEAAGFSGYLEKPLVLHRVLEEVERYLGRLDKAGTDLEQESVREASLAAAPAAAPELAPRRTQSTRARAPARA
jgi:two-component system, cell cycle response regulator DivK